MEARRARAPTSDAAGEATSRGPRASSAAIERAGELLAEAERPVIMAGTDLYWGRGEQELLALAQTLRIPVFLNGLARGCVPADHELFFSRARSQGLKGADVALVIGVPMDFRLAFGASFGEDTEIVVVDVAEPERAHPRAVAAECYGPLPATLERSARGGRARRRWRASAWIAELRATRDRAARRPSEPSARTTARRCIRCACTPSSARCSTATRS